MSHQNQQLSGGLITEVAPGSLADKLGVLPGDVLMAVNGQPVEDVIDVQYYAAEYQVELTVHRDDQEITLIGERSDLQPLGLDFDHPTFDIDIRRCNNLCEFCFVLQMAPRFRRTLYIKDDDYRYSFLYGHYVTLTNLSEHDTARIVEQNLSPLYVSVHDTDLERRRAYLRNPDAPDIIQQMRHFIDQGIKFHTQIVVTPGINDGSFLEQSIHDLATLYPGLQSISIVPVGLTAHHKYGLRTNTRDEANAVLDQCHQWQAGFRKQFGLNLIYPTDEWYLVTGRPIPPLDALDGYDLRENGLGMVRHFMDEWTQSKKEIRRRAKVKSLTLVTAALFAPTLTQYADEFAKKSRVQTNVVPISNIQLGDTITVAGLLMGKDVIDQLKECVLAEVIVLPRVMFDHPDGIALDNTSPTDIARTLDRSVALADLMGDLVDVIYGKPALYFTPSGEQIISPDAITQEGGWAIEKYL